MISVVGLGCAPIFPSMLHATPVYFGAERSLAMQMACAYMGATLMPSVFALLVGHLGVFLYPGFLLFFVLLMGLTSEGLKRVM